jgi:phosphate transport system permease protein
MQSKSSETLFRTALAAFGVAVVALMCAIAVFLTVGAWPALRNGAVNFLLTQTWNPVNGIFGMLAVLFGTLVSSTIAVAIAAPLGVGAAIFLQELAPRRIAAIFSFLIEMLAAVPSVIFGLWGFFILAPIVRDSIAPLLTPAGDFIPLLKGPSFGVGMLTAGVVLALMILPTMAAVVREIFSTIPGHLREAALGLGSTRWEAIRVAVLAPSKSGILSAAVLATARALGETMAVTMVIGNRNAISASLFSPGQTMASLIANEYAEASEASHIAALMAVGLMLLLISLVVNAVARRIAKRSAAKWK